MYIQKSGRQLVLIPGFWLFDRYTSRGQETYAVEGVCSASVCVDVGPR